jgi:hypothetical protein
MTNSVDITRIINEAKDGVDNSVFGPLFVTSVDNITEKKVNNLALAIFQTVLQAMLKEMAEKPKA